MKLHILTKIRITIVIAAAAALSWLINTDILYNNNDLPINIVFSGNYGALLLYTALAAGISLAAAFLIGRNNRYIAPLASPFILFVPAILSDNSRQLLIDYQGQAARANLSRLLFFDALLWYIPILVGLITVVLANRFLFRNKNKAAQEQNNRLNFDMSLSKCLLAAGTACIIAIILLPIFCQGDQTRFTAAGSTITLSTVASTGQQAFAVTAAFFLAVMASHQLFRTTGRAYLPVPLIVAGYFYLRANNSIWDSLSDIGASCLLLPPGFVTLSVVPLTFVVFGSIGIIWGYWNSYKLHFARVNNLIKVK
ncbi:MAG: hypothetical protein JXM68_00495 [Sedimentisphaerales bacterium]|nr:hypothetical protein [Sedimentisphaerales bacterium]